MGVLASRKPDSLFSGVVTVFSLIGYAMPVFWTGILLVILFGKVWPIMPIAGMRDVRMMGAGTWANMLDVLHHLVLPAVTLGLIYLAQYSRLARASMLEVLGSDYIRTARAKGLSKSRVVFKHALRNAVIPVVALAAVELGFMLGGSVVIESVYSMQGLGQLAWDAISRNDYPVVQAVVLIIAMFYIGLTFLADVINALLDPRIRTR
jgi:peptide/nickel transport system permease protein